MQDSIRMMQCIQPTIVIGSPPSSNMLDVSQPLTVTVDSPIRRVPLRHPPRSPQNLSVGYVCIRQTSPHMLTVDHVRQISPSAVHRNGPVSPQHWRASLDTLSADLGRICCKSTGSTERVSPQHPVKRFTALLTTHTNVQQLRPVSAETLNTCNMLDTKLHPVNAGNTTGNTTTTQNRSIRVRHEETELKLKQSLTAICGMTERSHTGQLSDEKVEQSCTLNVTPHGVCEQNKSNATSEGDTTSSLKKSPQLQLKESLKSGVRVKVDLESLGGVESVAVCASGEDRYVYVYACGAGTDNGRLSGDRSLSDNQSSHKCLSAVEVRSDNECAKKCSSVCENSLSNESECHAIQISQDHQDDSNHHITSNLQHTTSIAICHENILLKEKMSAKEKIPEVKISAEENVDKRDCEAKSREWSGNAMRLIHTASLSETATLSVLVASIVGTTLYIRERPKHVILNYFGGVSGVGIPLVLEDEPAMQFTIILHVACEYYRKTATSSNILLVKTVDDSLIIKGQGFTEYKVKESQNVLEEITKGRFSVAMKLPEGSDSRTVIAELSPIGQLIIHGRLNPTSRRMTCNF